MSRASRGPTQNVAGARRRAQRGPRGGLSQPATPALIVAVVLPPPLPVQALWWSSPATRATPLAIMGEGRLLAVCPHAAAAGCAAGQTTAQARLLCPPLLLCPPSPVEPWLWETALRALATVSPVVEETDRQRGVACLDGHGLERLWGPPTAICQRALDTLAAEGLQAWAGAGPTRLIALACAERQGPHGAPMVHVGPEAAAFLAALPLDDPALGALPLAALAQRFGPDVLAAWRGARGEHDPLRAWPAPLCRQVTEGYEEGVADSVVLQRLLTRLCSRLANDLAAAGLAAARLVLCLECDGGARQVEQAEQERWTRAWMKRAQQRQRPSPARLRRRASATTTGTQRRRWGTSGRAGQHSKRVRVEGHALARTVWGVSSYTREITTRPIRFTCAWCQDTVTQQRFPGPLPAYCSEDCTKEAQRAQTRERVRRYRERQR